MSIKHKNHSKKFHAFLLVIFLFGILIFAFAVSSLRLSPKEDTRYGVTFSTTYTDQLGLDYKDLYTKIVTDLGVKAVRLPVYWKEVETENNVFDWEKLDWIVKTSEQNNVKLTIVTGEKVPRWPECFVPDWAKSLSREDHQKEVLGMIEETVLRYKNSPALERWQVENEPFFPFGVCNQISEEELTERVDLVRRLDNHKIQLTVSGEMEPWNIAADKADILGMSLYRKTYNELFGYFVYPLTPEFYLFRARLIKEDVEKVIVSELQAEPWFSAPIESRPAKDWYEVFDKTDFNNQIEFVQSARLEEVYLWGVEWWEYLRQNGEPALWNEARKVFKK